MKRLLLIAFLPLVSGCLTANMPTVAYWPLTFKAEGTRPIAPKYGVVRLVQATVRSPYADPQLAVMRPNGSLAFDAYNEFAASPNFLLKGFAADAFGNSGLFAEVIGGISTAHADVSAEIDVTELFLDCRAEGARMAQASVAVRLIDGERKSILSCVTGRGSADAAEGLYGLAFSQALQRAFDDAFAQLKK